MWVHVLLAKFASHRALGNTIEALSHYDLDLSQGTITDGLRRLTPLLEPIYEAILARNGESFYRQADETRWSVFVEQEGKTGYRWWLWAFLGEDATAIRIEPTELETNATDSVARTVSIASASTIAMPFRARLRRARLMVVVFCVAVTPRPSSRQASSWCGSIFPGTPRRPRRR